LDRQDIAGGMSRGRARRGAIGRGGDTMNGCHLFLVGVGVVGQGGRPSLEELLGSNAPPRRGGKLATLQRTRRREVGVTAPTRGSHGFTGYK
jgi:hypothetical protein